jgi:hypothetical protein
VFTNELSQGGGSYKHGEMALQGRNNNCFFSGSFWEKSQDSFIILSWDTPTLCNPSRARGFYFIFSYLILYYYSFILATALTTLIFHLPAFGLVGILYSRLGCFQFYRTFGKQGLVDENALTFDGC